jgi:Fe-S cluster biogenesis protein NfuA
MRSVTVQMEGGAGAAAAAPAGGVSSAAETDRILAVGERIERVLERGAPGSPVAREDARDLVRVLTELYGAGLERILDLVDEAGALDDALLARLAGDPLVGSLLTVHGLHPYDTRERVERALASVGARVAARGADVELVEEGGGKVRVRVTGGGGCASTSAAVVAMVRAAIEEAVPEAEVEVEQTSAPSRSGAFIPVESLLTRPDQGPQNSAESCCGSSREAVRA